MDEPTRKHENPSEDPQNTANLEPREIIEHFSCEECTEEYLFKMRDNYHEFSIGLTTILSCLALAQGEGALPELPADWWSKAINRYRR
jgi:hypothetical protein